VNWECDIRTGILTFDDRFSTLYGTDAEGKGINHMTAEAYVRELVHPEDRGVLADEAEKTRTTTDPRYVSKREYRIIRRDGGIRHIEMCVGITKDAEGRTIKTHGVNQDITERKKAEEALRRVNRQLNLLSGITRHDIRNQLMAMKGYLEISSEYPDDPDKIAECIHKEIAIAQTIEDQINITRIFEGMGVKEPVWQPVFPLVKKALSAFLMINVTVDLDGAEIVVFADPMLEKVFFNLLDNSLRHGKRVTEIRVSSHKSGEDLVVVWEDNGIGIAADEKERIFERGFGKHTGLGMFLVREILSLTGITIKETGEPGKGARFEITVPDRQYRFSHQ
jgi:PAS domain S-box-containing protein